jgi:hypothetical protein
MSDLEKLAVGLQLLRTFTNAEDAGVGIYASELVVYFTRTGNEEPDVEKVLNHLGWVYSPERWGWIFKL